MQTKMKILQILAIAGMLCASVLLATLTSCTSVKMGENHVGSFGTNKDREVYATGGSAVLASLLYNYNAPPTKDWNAGGTVQMPDLNSLPKVGLSNNSQISPQAEILKELANNPDLLAAMMANSEFYSVGTSNQTKGLGVAATAAISKWFFSAFEAIGLANIGAKKAVDLGAQSTAVKQSEIASQEALGLAEIGAGQ